MAAVGDTAKAAWHSTLPACACRHALAPLRVHNFLTPGWKLMNQGSIPTFWTTRNTNPPKPRPNSAFPASSMHVLPPLEAPWLAWAWVKRGQTGWERVG